MFHQRRQHTICFAKTFERLKKNCKVFLSLRQVQLYRRKRKKVNTSDNKMKKYKDLYEEENGRHEETLQRYQEDNMDEMEIINLHKRWNKKARKTPQPKNATKSPKSDDSSQEEQNPKKASRSRVGKKATTKAGKKVKKTPPPKNSKKSPELINSSEEEEKEPSQDDKGEKYLLF